MLKGTKKGATMLRFITVTMILLLCTAQGFFHDQLYVIETINEGIVTLEALTLDKQGQYPFVFYCDINKLPSAKEGQVILVKFAGNYLIKLEPQEQITEERQVTITNLLERLKHP